MCRNLQVLAQPEIFSATPNSTTPQNPEINPSKLSHDDVLTASSTMLGNILLQSPLSTPAPFQSSTWTSLSNARPASHRFPTSHTGIPTLFEPPSLSFRDPDCPDIDILIPGHFLQSPGVKQAFSFHLEVPGTLRRATRTKRTKRGSTIDIVLP